MLWVWYRGDRFQGWQSQGTGGSVQEALERALAARGVEGRPMPAGRTDRGVHARCQPVSLRVPAETSTASLLELGDEDWGVAAALPAPEGFHAQWSSTSKEYRYRLAMGPVPPGWEHLVWGPATHPRLAGRTVDLGQMRAALEHAVGTRDFSALHAPSSVRRHRTLQAVRWAERDGLVEVALVGDAFGRYGVRLLVGGAALLGAGVVDPRTWERALESASVFEGLRAPAGALTLWSVGYPGGLEPFTGPRPRLPDRPPFVPLLQA